MLQPSQVGAPGDSPDGQPFSELTQASGNHHPPRVDQAIDHGDATAELPGGRWRREMKHRQVSEQTPLAVFVQNRLAELGMKQSEFCRLTGFDQGLLSKIHSSMIINLSLETALRLAVGLSVAPDEILALIDREDLQALITRAYPAAATSAQPSSGEDLPAPVREINQLAMRAYTLGRSLSPVIGVLAHLAITRGERSDALAMKMSLDG